MAKAKEKQIAEAAYEDLPQAKLSRRFSNPSRSADVQSRAVAPRRVLGDEVIGLSFGTRAVHTS